jgi:CDP-glucose 4,6-dehydratase
MQPHFFRNKRVFLTGHTGFKGGWLALWLQRLGADVCGYSLAPSTEPNLFSSAQVAQGIRSVIGDIRDFEKLEATIREHNPEIVFHAAAQALVLPSYGDPVGTFATNVMGTVHLLDAVRRASSVRVVINVTSDKCYENKETRRGYREDDPMGGHDPYSASKGAAELVTAAYRRSFFDEKSGVRLASVRAGNVIGGGDWSENRLVPDIIRAFSKGEKVRLRHPRAVRAWQHVLDPLAGYLTLAEALWNDQEQKFARGWNFGPPPDEVHEVEKVTGLLAARWGEGVAYEIDKSAATPHEAGLLLLDSSLAHENLGWRPRLSFEESLAFTADWYRAFYKGGNDMRRFTMDQIGQLSASAAGSPARRNLAS